MLSKDAEVLSDAMCRRRVQMTFAHHDVPHSILGVVAIAYLPNWPLRLGL
jgi:hypothetical protein